MPQSTPKPLEKLLPKPVRSQQCQSDKMPLKNSSFHEGLEVRYDKENGDTFYGKIQFVCESYVTVCIRESENSVGGCCLLVYPDDYNRITPLSSIRQRNE